MVTIIMFPAGLDRNLNKTTVGLSNSSMKLPVVKLPFSLKTWGTALVVNRAGGLLKREACISLELLSLLASVHQTANALFPQR